MTTYHTRKARGHCPVCGGRRADAEFILCQGCRIRVTPQRAALPPERSEPNKWFIGLHEWMIQQGKFETPDYEI